MLYSQVPSRRFMHCLELSLGKLFKPAKFLGLVVVVLVVADEARALYIANYIYSTVEFTLAVISTSAGHLRLL